MIMKHVRSKLRLSALALLFVVVAAAALPTAQAQVNPPTPEWYGWSVEVDFPLPDAGELQEPHVVYTTYWGIYDPDPKVIQSESDDISDFCDVEGALLYSGTTATFDGSSYIVCDVPSWRETMKGQWNINLPDDFCLCELRSPLLVHADVTLLSGTRANPLFYFDNLDIGANLPSNGNTARTVLHLPTLTHSSPLWNITPTGNHVAMGQYGEAVVEVADYFEHRWLDHLTDMRWRNFFNTQVTDTEMGHWYEAPGISTTRHDWNAAPYSLRTGSTQVYIGYNPATNQYFEGDLRRGGIDPGCLGN
jgi:hypothetical protein